MATKDEESRPRRHLASQCLLLGGLGIGLAIWVGWQARSRDDTGIPMAGSDAGSDRNDERPGDDWDPEEQRGGGGRIIERWSTRAVDEVPLTDVERQQITDVGSRFVDVLRSIEADSTEVFADYEWEGRQFLELVLRGPTSNEVGAAFKRAVDRSGIEDGHQLRALKLALQEASKEYRLPEGSVGRIVFLSELSGSPGVYSYRQMGIKDWSYIKRNSAGRMAPPPEAIGIPEEGGIAPRSGTWRFSHIVQPERR